MTTIFDEFRFLDSDPFYKSAIDILEAAKLSKQDAKKLANQAIRVVCPPTPSGMMHTRSDYHREILLWGVIALTTDNKEYADGKAAIMRQKRERHEKNGKQYPPKPVYQAAKYAPQRRAMN